MATRVKFSRVDTAANFTSANPILADGEITWEKDTSRAKVGDGVTAYNLLPYRFEGVTDHGALTGLADDDHTQYLNETRHDALPSDNPHGVTAAQAGADPSGTAASAVAAHESASDPHPQYLQSGDLPTNHAVVDANNNFSENQTINKTGQTALTVDSDTSSAGINLRADTNLWGIYADNSPNELYFGTNNGPGIGEELILSQSELDVKTKPIRNVVDPVNPQDAATKAYVDASGVTDHGALTGLADDDHTQYLNETRHDALPSDNPHGVTAAQVGADPVGSAAAAQAFAIQRANHTGTQLASTISDFQAEVSSNSDVIANTAKVTNATHTGDIAGSTSTTAQPAIITSKPLVTVDAADFLLIADASDASNLKRISASDFLSGGGGLPFFASASKVSDNVSEVGVNNTTNQETYLSLTFTAPNAGTYVLTFDYTWSLNSSSSNFQGFLYLDGSIIREHIQEPQDSSGTGVTLRNTTGGSTNSGTDQRHGYHRSFPVVLTAGSHTIDIRWDCQFTSSIATIYEGDIMVQEVLV